MTMRVNLIHSKLVFFFKKNVHLKKNYLCEQRE
jgi:hypothetical protein